MEKIKMGDRQEEDRGTRERGSKAREGKRNGE